MCTRVADNDVWMKPRTKGNRMEYYKYVLIYVDDILCFSEKPKEVMDSLSRLYRLKDGSVQIPERYLGAEILRYQVLDGQ